MHKTVIKAIFISLYIFLVQNTEKKWSHGDCNHDNVRAPPWLLKLIAFGAFTTFRTKSYYTHRTFIIFSLFSVQDMVMALSNITTSRLSTPPHCLALNLQLSLKVNRSFRCSVDKCLVDSSHPAVRPLLSNGTICLVSMMSLPGVWLRQGRVDR